MAWGPSCGWRRAMTSRASAAATSTGTKSRGPTPRPTTRARGRGSGGCRWTSRARTRSPDPEAHDVAALGRALLVAGGVVGADDHAVDAGRQPATDADLPRRRPLRAEEHGAATVGQLAQAP